MHLFNRRYVVIMVFCILILPVFIFHCDVQTTRTRDRLRDYIDTIKIVNTHEHQRIPESFADLPLNFYHLLYHSYLHSDMVSAGAKYFALVFNINQLVTASSERYHLTREDSPSASNPYKMAGAEGFAIESLDDYLAYGALGKMFPNVYLDLVWLPQISRQAAVQAIDELLDLVPYNKFFLN